MKKIKAAIQVPVTITDFKTFGTAEQDNGNGVVRFNSNVSEIHKLELKRDNLLRITYHDENNSDKNILALFRDARQKKGNLLALEYDQQLKLFGTSAIGKEKLIGIQKVGKIPAMFWYLWDHPKLELKYNFRVSFVYSVVLTLVGFILGYVFGKFF